MEVEKTEGKQMGLQLKTVAGKAVVSKVESGLLEEYNKNYPSTAVKEGDTILSANGKRGKASDIATEVGKTIGTVKLQIPRSAALRRPPAASDFKSSTTSAHESRTPAFRSH